METLSTNKKTFKDKIKDRVSLLKQKSSDTLLHARSSYVREKLHDNIEFQHCVESFLPQLHHENEIKEALLENVVEMRVKESSQARQEQRKREDDFFTGVWKDITNSSSKSKKKIKSPTADIVSSPLNEDDIDEHKITPSIKTTLKYFDTEINEKSLVTSTIISRMNWENDVNSLLWDGKEKPIENCLSRRNIKEEGFFVGSKPRARSQRLRGILSHADDQSEWFDTEGELMLEDNPVCELNNQIRYIPIKEVELLTIFTKPVLFSNKNVKRYVPLETQNEFGEYLIEFNFRTLNFNHHPLFSIEHIIAQKVVKAYDLYIKTQTQGTLKQHEDLLSSLRRTKAFNEQRILLENDNSQKRLYKNADFRKNIKEIAKVRKSRFKEAFIQRKLENELLKLWRNMKHIRKQLKYTSTSLVLEVTKTETDIIEDRDAWEEQFELEVSDIIAKIKCDYFELRSDFSKKSKRLKRTSPDSESELSQKPQLEYDEVKIRKNLFNEMCETFRQPGEPIISFKLSRSSAIITETPSVSSEVNRRLDVDKTKLFIQVLVNNRDVCKTKNIPLNHDFILKIQESGSIRLPKDTKSIKLLIFEHSSFLRPTSIGEVFITIPKNNVLISDAKTESYPFLLKNKRNYNHIGVGTCNTLAEIINKKHPQLVLQNMDLQEVIVCEGSVNMKIGWTTETGTEDISNQLQANPSAANFVLPKEIPNAEIMSQLFDAVLDPNDPKNSFLFTFMNNFKDKAIKNDKFYLNYFFNFDFLLTRTSDPYVDMKSIVDTDNERELVRGNHLEVMSNDGASTSTISRPRGSVLDDTTLLKKILDPIDLQRRTSIRYLQLVNEHLSLQSDNGKKEKQLSDIVTIFKYPGIKTITINFLRPKRPLFYQTRQQPSTPKLQIVDTKRDYTLKICILKAFQLPCRSKTIQTGTSSNTDEDGGLKMISLKPFVRVTCQGRSLRTSTAVGNNPTWNEQLCFPVRFDTSSTISFHLFDETFEDLLADDRLENSTVHCQYSANWLGSMKILLPTVFSQTKIEGTFLMNSPPDLFGYKQNLEEKYAHSRVSYDSLRKEIHFKQREGFFMTMFLEIFPSYLDPPPPVEILETNEMDYMIKHIENFTETYKSAFPERKLDVLVLDTSGKYICITRLFKPLPLPEFGDNLSTMFANASAYEESVSSKNSTPNKKKSSKNQSGDDAATRSTKSVISTIVGEVRRSSKTVKDTFEMKSLDENLTDSAERGLASKIQICTRFVAMIPLFELNSLSNHSVALSGYQTLRLVCGSMMDHTTLLMNYFLYLGIDCWFISGLALPRGLSTYVLVQENQQTKELRGKEGLKSYARLPGVKTKNVWKYCIYDATTGIKYDTKDPFCPLQRVYFVCNGENIWVNIQAVERCNLTKFDLSASSEWRPLFQRDSLLACPGPLPGLPSGDTALYSYTSQDTLSLRDAVEDKIRNKIQRWRGHRRTIWNRHCSSVLKSMLVHWEKWSLNQSSQKPRNSQKLQQLLLSYQMYGFPYNTTYTSMGEIVSAMKATQIHLDEHTSTEFALGVEVFPYPNNIYSVWIYLASVVRN